MLRNSIVAFVLVFATVANAAPKVKPEERAITICSAEYKSSGEATKKTWHKGFWSECAARVKAARAAKAN